MNRKNNSKITSPLLTALYCRLSLEDGKDNESMSISNQKLLLKDYAERMVCSTVSFMWTTVSQGGTSTVRHSSV